MKEKSKTRKDPSGLFLKHFGNLSASKKILKNACIRIKTNKKKKTNRLTIFYNLLNHKTKQKLGSNFNKYLYCLNCVRAPCIGNKYLSISPQKKKKIVGFSFCV